MSARLVALSALFLAMCPGFAWSDTTFRHPNLGVTVLVPDGWTAESQNAGVNVKKLAAFASLFVIPRNGTSVALVEEMVPQIKRSWQTFDETRRGNCAVAGLEGFCVWASGVDPRGIDMTTKIAGAMRDGKGYILVVSMPRQHTAKFTADLNRLEQSISWGVTGSTAAAPRSQGSAAAQMAALDKAYQEGKLSTDEYESRRNALSGQGAPQRSTQAAPPRPDLSREAPAPAQPAVMPAPQPPPAAERTLPPSPSAKVPFGARIFIAPMENGLDGFIAPEILKKRVPVVIVTEEKEAEYVMAGSSQKVDDKWYHAVFGGKDKNEGNIRLLSIREKQLVWAGEAGDRSLWWGALKRGGQRKVAERIVNQMNKELFRK